MGVVIGYFAEELTTGRTLADNADEPFPAASVLKIALALEAHASLDLGERVVVRDEDKVIGSGVLSALTPGLSPTLGDLVYLACAISDNTAANIVLERTGVDRVNARLEALGLATTRVRGKIFTPDQGELSPVTPREAARLVALIARREAAPAAACDAVMALLGKTQTASTIGRGLPDSRFDEDPPVRLAHKTGSIAGVVHDVGIVRTADVAYVVALMSKGSDDRRPNHDNVARVRLGEISRSIYEEFTRAR